MRVADQGEEGSGACTRIRAGGAAVCPPQLPQLPALNAMIGRVFTNRCFAPSFTKRCDEENRPGAVGSALHPTGKRVKIQNCSGSTLGLQ